MMNRSNIVFEKSSWLRFVDEVEKEIKNVEESVSSGSTAISVEKLESYKETLEGFPKIRGIEAVEILGEQWAWGRFKVDDEYKDIILPRELREPLLDEIKSTLSNVNHIMPRKTASKLSDELSGIDDSTFTTGKTESVLLPLTGYAENKYFPYFFSPSSVTGKSELFIIFDGQPVPMAHPQLIVEFFNRVGHGEAIAGFAKFDILSGFVVKVTFLRDELVDLECSTHAHDFNSAKEIIGMLENADLKSIPLGDMASLVPQLMSGANFELSKFDSLKKEYENTLSEMNAPKESRADLQDSAGEVTSFISTNVGNNREEHVDAPKQADSSFYPFMFKYDVFNQSSLVSIYSSDGGVETHDCTENVMDLLHRIDKDSNHICGLMSYQLEGDTIVDCSVVYYIAEAIWDCIVDEDLSHAEELYNGLINSGVLVKYERLSNAYTEDICRGIIQDLTDIKEIGRELEEAKKSSSTQRYQTVQPLVSPVTTQPTQPSAKSQFPDTLDDNASWYTGTANLEFFATYFKFEWVGSDWCIIDLEGSAFTLMGDIFVPYEMANIHQMETSSFTNCYALLPDGSLMNGYNPGNGNRIKPSNYMQSMLQAMGLTEYPNYLQENMQTEFYKTLASWGGGMVSFANRMNGLDIRFSDCRKRCFINPAENDRPYMYWKGILMPDDERDLNGPMYIFKPTYSYSMYNYDYVRNILCKSNKDIDEYNRQLAKQIEKQSNPSTVDIGQLAGNMAKSGLNAAKGLFNRFKK